MNEEHHHHGYLDEKERYLARLKRIEGQARGIYRMVEEDKYCIDILTQISAMKSALENVALGLLDAHMKTCVIDAARHNLNLHETLRAAQTQDPDYAGRFRAYAQEYCLPEGE